MFFRKKSTLNLTKLYFVVSKTDGVVDLDFISTNLFQYCINHPAKYALDYGTDKDISKFRGHIDVTKFEYLEIVDIQGNVVLTVRRQLKNEGCKTVLQLMLLGELDESFSNEVKVVTCVKNRFDLIYGYSRVLRSDFLPASETKIRKGLFATEIKSEAPEAWLFEQSEIETGAIKGIYPLNYWTSSALQKLADIDFQLPEVSSGDERNIYFFSESKQGDIMDKNPKFLNYLRFDDLGTG